MPRTARIGTAGWSIPSRYAAMVGEGDSALARYATRFNAVEINSAFYRPHQHKTYQRWATTVPADFRFSVKLPKTISHELALRGAGPALDAFLAQVQGLGEKLGVLLLQLPPRLAFDARQASAFFRMVRARTQVAMVCEPRHASWFEAPVASIFERYGVDRVGADPARVAEAGQPLGRRLAYWRLHGAPRIYYSQYDDAALQTGANDLRAAAALGLAPWVIFDNTAHGFALADAARLQDLLNAHLGHAMEPL